jgi:ABC-type Zn2+ transport system substrate-binding protein/surface adhesin
LFEQEPIRTLYRNGLKALHKHDDDDDDDDDDDYDDDYDDDDYDDDDYDDDDHDVESLLLFKFYILRSVNTLAVVVIIFTRTPCLHLFLAKTFFDKF